MPIVVELSPGIRHTFRCCHVDHAEKVVEAMQADGWRLHSWEPAGTVPESEIAAASLAPIMLAFTRPDEITMVDVGPLRERLRRLHGQAFGCDRSGPVTPRERVFYDQGRADAYGDALDRLNQLLGR